MKDLLQRCLPYVPADLAEEIHEALQKPAGRATRLSPSWAPDPSLMDWASRERPDVHCAREVEQFKDFWLSKSGANACKLDWNRTFKVWMRNARPSQKPVVRNEPNPSPATVIARRKVEPQPASPALQALFGDMMKKLHISGGAV